MDAPGRSAGPDLASDTGGLAFFNRNDLEARPADDRGGSALVLPHRLRAAEVDVLEVLGRPKFHKIKLTVDRPGVRVRTRAGFYGVTDDGRPEAGSALGVDDAGSALDAVGDPCAPSSVAALLTLAACGGGDSPTAPGGTPSQPPAFAVRLDVDTAAGRQPISPYVYGHNQADWSGRHRGLRLGRLGGNRWTAYDWETNASNAGSDFRHQNDSFLGGGDVPGEAVRPHVAAARAAGAAMVVTVPMAGYVSADKRGDGDVAATPGYLETRFHESLPQKPGALRYPPDTGDGVVYQDEFVAWVEATFPRGGGPPVFYSLDNEPDLWAARTRASGRRARSRTRRSSSARPTGRCAIKSVAPDALVFGPVSYGWQGFVRLQNAPDARGRDFLDVYLAEMAAAGAALRPAARGRARRALVPGGARRRRARDGGERRRRGRGRARAGAAVALGPVVRRDELDLPGRGRRRHPPPPAAAREDRGARAGHAPRDHRVQLRRRRPHLGRARAGGRARRLRARGPLRRGVLEPRVVRAVRGRRVRRVLQLRRRRRPLRRHVRRGADLSDLANVTVYASVDGDDRVVVVAINKNAGAASADLTVAHPATCARPRTR